MSTNHFITLQKGIDMTALYRQEKENILALPYKNLNILPLSETFDRAAFDTLLAETGCISVRIYYGMSEDLLVHAIIVGVNESNEDILPPAQNPLSTEALTDYVILEQSIRCPPDCAPLSPLNE